MATMSSFIILFGSCIGHLVFPSCVGIDAPPLSVQPPLSRVVEQLGLSETEVVAADTVNREVLEIRNELQPIWGALAKNKRGEVNSEQARFALKRYFGQRLGWKVASLESARGSPSTNTLYDDNSASPSTIKKAVNGTRPESTDSIGLGGVASFAKAIKSAIGRMEKKRLLEAYQVLELPVDTGSKVPEAGTDRVLDAYVASLVLGRDFIKPDVTGVPFEAKAKQVYNGWSDTQLWLRDVRRSDEFAHKTSESPFGGAADAGRSFAQVERVVGQVQEGFGRFQDAECRRLRDTLLAVQDNSTGMVRLSEFYRRGFETGFQFVEKAAYLQQLGALDTTGSEEPRVVVANYVLSEANCLSEANEWSVCCINECDSYLEHLESKLASAYAPAERIAAIVEELVFAVNESAKPLSIDAREQLEELAREQGSFLVHLHSWAFADWLHTVFPSVCPRSVKSKETDATASEANLTEVLMRPQGMRKYIDYMQRRHERSQFSLQALLVQEDDVMEQWEELLFLPEALPDAAQEFANALRQGVLTLMGLGLLFLAFLDTVRRCLGLDSCLGYHANFLCLAM